MKSARYPFPIPDELYIENYDLYKCPVSIAFSDGINVVFGANGLGKSTLLYIIQYSILGPYAGSLRMRSYRGEQRTRRPIHDGDFFRLRMNKQDENASVTVKFKVDETLFTVKHSLYKDTLHSVKVNNIPLEGSVISYKKYEGEYYSQTNKKSTNSKVDMSQYLIQKYHDILVSTIGVPDMDALITMMTDCVFFTEGRTFTFWESDLNNLIISKYLMDQEGYRKLVVEQQNVTQYDSQQRLKTYEISFIKRFLGESDTENNRNKHKYTLEDLNNVNKKITSIESSYHSAQQQFNSCNSERIDTRLSIEDIKTRISELDSAWYKAVFPEPYKNAFNRYSISLLSGNCPFCENKSDFVIKPDKCFLCKHNVRTEDETDLHMIESKKRALQQDLKVLEGNYTLINKNLDSIKKSVVQMEKELSEKNKEKQKIEAYLSKDPDENYKKLKALEAEQKEYKKKLEQSRINLREIMKTLDTYMKDEFIEFANKFKKYADSFFGNSYSTRLELISDKENRLFLFFLNNKRRSSSDSLSESQRIFVDFAFRLTVLDYFHTASYFMCETPDSTLDIISESNAVDTLSYYVKSGNRLFLTANARNSELISELLQRHKNQYNVINLFELSALNSYDLTDYRDLSAVKYLLGGK